MNERRRLFDRDFNEKWEEISNSVDNSDIYVYNNEMDFLPVIDFEKDKEIKRKYILRFLVIPVIYKNKKGIITCSPFNRVPSFISKEFSDFIIIAKKSVCEKITFKYLASKNKLKREEKETPLTFISKMLVKMEKLKASDLTLSWTSEKVIAKYTVGDQNLKNENDFLDLDFSEKIRVALVNLAHERPSNDLIDGKIITMLLGEEKEYRLSVIKTVVGYAIVLRSYQKFNKELKVKDLGYTDTAFSILNEIISDNSHGLFLICGPTGSGKTTTIYTILQEMYEKEDLKIKTAEDPVEIQIDGIDQCNINRHGLLEHQITYTKILSKYMRQKPDVIMIGEIRDSEVAKSCVESALTGHLTISTLHTADVESTISRLVNSLNIAYDEIEDSVVGILNQKLVKKLCDCKEIDSENNGFKAHKDGCSKCLKMGTPGYFGDILASEIVKMKLGIKNYKPENYEKFYSYKDCAKDLFDSGSIDKRTKTYIEKL